MRLKTLNGAPLREHLDFSEKSLLVTTTSSNFSLATCVGQSTEDRNALKWRDIGAKNTRLRTGWSQPYLPGSGLQSFDHDRSFVIPGVEQSTALPEYETSNLDTTLALDEQTSAIDDYLQHSLGFYDTLLSSQVIQDEAADNTVSSSSFLTTSFGTTASGLSSSTPADSHVLVLKVPSATVITALGTLPSARHLRSIYPQTLTPNFLCAILTTPERREVYVRKSGYKMDLWEITVGDDTSSNFKVTFWLRPPRESNNEQSHPQAQLLQTLERLQVGNIVLLRNIALTSFRDTVYGQSLNAAITRARTSVDILMKDSSVSAGQIGGLPAPVVEMLTRVKRWTRAHVVSDTNHDRKRRRGSPAADRAPKRVFESSAQGDVLPPDTMESV
jgi:hypothetical protein